MNFKWILIAIQIAMVIQTALVIQIAMVTQTVSGQNKDEKRKQIGNTYKLQW